MLKKNILILITTAISATIAAGEFFFIGNIPRHWAPLIHNTLASLIGIGFIITSKKIQQETGKWHIYPLLLLTIGVAMLAIHLIKIFFTRCS